MDDTDSTRVDMSPEAIDRRLREASQISKLCLSLSQAAVRAGVLGGKAGRVRDGSPDGEISPAGSHTKAR